MAGHSHWAGIKHKKGKADKQRSKIFSKLSKEITVAAKLGDKNPDMNARLRSAIQSARSANMPKDNIERAIDKSSISADSNFENLRYEGFGPNKTAVIVETLTDNKNRTASNIRTIFQKSGGGLGTQGSASHNFQQLGVIKIDKDEREIFISSIKLLSIMGNEINIEVSCSSGTYIRSLAEDIGELFNCPAYLKDLRRTRSGNFYVKNAIKLPEESLPIDKIISPNDALNCFNEIQCAPDIVDKLRNGQFVESNLKYDSSTILRLRDSKRGFIGLVEYNEGLLKPKRFLENFLSTS